MTNDHHHDKSPVQATADILRELRDAINRRGLSDATFGEVFILQRATGEGWTPDTECVVYDVMPDLFAKRVAEWPDAGWRIAVKHTIVVETMLVEHSTEVRG